MRWTLAISLVAHGALIFSLGKVGIGAKPAREIFFVSSVSGSKNGNGGNAKKTPRVSSAKRIAGNDPGPVSKTESEGTSAGPISMEEIVGLGNSPPQYPEEAIAREWEGEVRLRLVTGADGVVAEVAVAQSSGHDILDRAASRAASAWRLPGKGLARFEVPIVFRLD